MKKIKIKTRCCILCRKKDYKNNFLRFYVTNNYLNFDETQNSLFHGYYLCKDKLHLEKIINYKIKPFLNFQLNDSIFNLYKDIYGKKK